MGDSVQVKPFGGSKKTDQTRCPKRSLTACGLFFCASFRVRSFISFLLQVGRYFFWARSSMEQLSSSYSSLTPLSVPCRRAGRRIRSLHLRSLQRRRRPPCEMDMRSSYLTARSCVATYLSCWKARRSPLTLGSSLRVA